ncbi:oleosin 1 [Cinnamomum micranthum f. kanehirae]|uniref:Oleosin 1 n=1 Tax=Cinnamomum micranthum f. kanehirae TaxID=337451 RepID=A0A443N4Y8_9MAGN|nr:oleosin 1 [Cinnamomum micranthum f. kanehirae]
MAEHPKTHKPPETALNTQPTLKFVTAATLGATLLVLSGMALTATVVLLVVATPLLISCGPVLVLAAIVMLLVAAVFLSAGGFVVATLSVLAWIYSYATGKHPGGSEQLYHATKALKRKAKVMRDKAREYGCQMQNMAQEVTQTQESQPQPQEK